MTAQALKQARLRLGLTQSQMAEALATPFRTYQDWEEGRSQIKGVVGQAVKWVEMARNSNKKHRKK